MSTTVFSMNFLLRSSQSVAPEPTFTSEIDQDPKMAADSSYSHQLAVSDYTPTKALHAEDGKSTGREALNSGGSGNGGSTSEVLRAKTRMVIEDHADVTSEEGAILVPSKKLPEKWHEVPDLNSIKDYDRNFVFPGEQLHIVVYITSKDEETKEVITPFKVAAVMSKGRRTDQNSSSGKDHLESGESSNESRCRLGGENGSGAVQHNDKLNLETQADKRGDVKLGESLLKMEGHKKRVSNLLESLKRSHFFVRIAGTNEPLWAKRISGKDLADSLNLSDIRDAFNRPQNIKHPEKRKFSAAVIEGGRFDPKSAGGIARNAVTCCSLPNGDVMVVLQVTVAADVIKDAMIEVLQFEKFETVSSSPVLSVSGTLLQSEHGIIQNSADPCNELLQWLLPLDRPLHPAVPPLSPVSLSSNSFSASSSQRPAVQGTSSALFSFGNLRSYSSNSLSNITSSPSSSPTVSSNDFNLEDWDRLTLQKTSKSHEVGSEGLLSFRGASLEPQRFSVHCGLEGLYVPGKRWRKKVEIIQPIEVESYFADCNTDDLVCVLIKNVIPAHLPDVIFFVDSISIICDIAAPGSPPVSIPISCIEAGNGHTLPGLVLRRGEQHSFILKPMSSVHKPSGGDHQNQNQFAVLVSCRCSHTESRITFKHATQWQPRPPRELMIAVESEIGKPAVESSGTISQLSPQVLTLQATNLTENNLNLTLLAPVSTASPQCVVSMSPSPLTAPSKSPLTFSDAEGKGIAPIQRSYSASFPSLRPLSDMSGMTSSDLKDCSISAADIMADTNSACTHLWLQSTVPLGCVPSLSTKTVRLELLPLTDGIITLDTLQIADKQKGVVYIPERSLKIYSTSSIASGIM